MHDPLERMLLDPSAEPTYLPLSLLKAITNNFSDDQRIGSGGFAVVYKGRLRNGAVAVKKLCRTLDTDEKKFLQEVDSLSRVKHENIVRFLGYCCNTQGKMLGYNGQNVMAEERERLLCFEFLPKGSLANYIKDASCGLDWSTTYDIIRGVCSGLHYLHTEHGIIHMDLKPENILLDNNMVPKIADFGAARLISRDKSQTFTKTIIGTLGYTAPEYINHGLISKQVDMYSLGVLIVELMTGFKPELQFNIIEESVTPSPSEEVIRKWRHKFPNEARSQHVDTCISIGLNCLKHDPHERPTTGDIIQMLNIFVPQKIEKQIDEIKDPISSRSSGKTMPKIFLGCVILYVLAKILPALGVVTLKGVLTIPLAVFLRLGKFRARMTLIALGAVLCAVLARYSPWSSEITAALNGTGVHLAIGVLEILHSELRVASWPQVIVFAKNIVLDAVLLLLMRSRPWVWVEVTLKPYLGMLLARLAIICVLGYSFDDMASIWTLIWLSWWEALNVVTGPAILFFTAHWTVYCFLSERFSDPASLLRLRILLLVPLAAPVSAVFIIIADIVDMYHVLLPLMQFK